MKSKDHCTMFPERIWGKDISECCRLHDETLSTSGFYKCLRTKVDIVSSILITAGGAIGCWVKCFSRMRDRV